MASVLRHFRFIDDEGIEKLKKWKYVGGEYTFLDKLMNPFWIWCETKTPRWMSPNAVTLTATVLIFLSTMLIAVCGHLVEDRLPIYALTIFAMFAYQTLDAVDGKHARIMGLTTPFGSMLDHGCDAFSMFLQGVLILLTISPTLDLSVWYFIAFIVSQSVFALGQWAAAFEGKLEHAGVTEAQFISMALPLLNVFFGADVWRIREFELCIATGLIGFGLYFGVSAVYRVPKVYGVTTIPTLLPILSINAIGLYLYCSGTFAQQPLFILASLGLTYVLTSLRLIIGNMAGLDVDAAHLMIPVSLLLVATAVPALFPALLVVNSLFFSFVACDTTTRVCRGLNIPVITVQLKSS